ncbi:chemerin-like receptor 1 [Xyrauchen texanus]|uniref:chemerin-like receptor 1 n=1 Tax=Xyrauchen texanus TaxID=154827 RepID=UPI0022425963|nr:chemerin-like receptor 1 [Xyrauchen texanus]XP_052003290.1 chemerin-like receptor 1 [Xyrauchen texanus]
MSKGLNGSWMGSVSVPSSIPPAFHSHLSSSADLSIAIFLIITGVVSVVGNGLVLLVYGQRRKKLRVHELMTINLAVCDFGYSLLGAPCLIISSLSHAWIFGETGCLWYGFQGFVFGIGSLITTCLISLDRCFKICSIQYGQWIERRHASLSIALVWIYTMFWASLPAFGFGSYGPEPFGTSCTINWWRMKSSLNDRVYIFAILTLCFGIPTCTIIASYFAILITVYRSGRLLASIPSSNVTHSSKDLRLTKIAAVVCSSFLIAWTPYAIVSLYSALTAREEHPGEDGGTALLAGMSGTVIGHGGGFPDVYGFPFLINWTSPEHFPDAFGSWRNITSDHHHSHSVGNSPSSAVGSVHGGVEEHMSHPVSSLRPEVTLIPAIFAKSHCMINPFIYQIMNRDFREDVYDLLFFRGKDGERRRGRSREGSDSDGHRGSISLSYIHSWRRRSTPTSQPSGERVKNESSRKSRGKRGSGQGNASAVWASLDTATLDIQANLEREKEKEGEKETKKEFGGSTSSSLVTCEE